LPKGHDFHTAEEESQDEIVIKEEKKAKMKWTDQTTHLDFKGAEAKVNRDFKDDEKDGKEKKDKRENSGRKQVDTNNNGNINHNSNNNYNSNIINNNNSNSNKITEHKFVHFDTSKIDESSECIDHTQ